MPIDTSQAELQTSHLGILSALPAFFQEVIKESSHLRKTEKVLWINSFLPNYHQTSLFLKVLSAKICLSQTGAISFT